jgi:tetratricopeptide (TPR) repeat protein
MKTKSIRLLHHSSDASTARQMVQEWSDLGIHVELVPLDYQRCSEAAGKSQSPHASVLLVSSSLVQSLNAMRAIGVMQRNPEWQSHFWLTRLPNMTLSEQEMVQFWQHQLLSLRQSWRLQPNDQLAAQIQMTQAITELPAQVWQSLCQGMSYEELMQSHYLPIFQKLQLEPLEVFKELVGLIRIPDEQEQFIAFYALLRKFPESAFLHFTRAKSVMRQKKYKEASLHFEESIKFDSTFVECYRQYSALLAYALNTPVDAKQLLEQGLRVAPNHAGLHADMGQLALDFMADASAARQHFELSLKANSEVASLHLRLAQLLIQQQSNTQLALQHLELALDIDPLLAPAHYWYGHLLQQSPQGQTLGKQHMQRAETLGYTPETHKNRSSSDSNNSLPDKDNVALHPDMPVERLIEQIQHWMRNGQLPQATQGLQMATQWHSNNPALLSQQAMLAELQNDMNAAKRFYEQAIQVDGAYVPALMNLAILSARHLNQIDRAKLLFLDVLDIEPDNVSAHFNYAFLLEEYFRDYEGAKKHYESALEIEPTYKVAQEHYSNLVATQFQMR